MLIGIDANEANVDKRVGSNVYAFEVLWQLYRQDKDNAYRIYLSAPPLADLPKTNKRWQYRILTPSFFWTQWRLPLSLWFDRPRPKVFLTLGHYAPRFSPVPTMVCIMDLAFLKYPETFRSRDLWQLKSWTEYSVKNARHVFTISQATKKDIISTYHIPAGKISIASPGVKRLKAGGLSPAKGKYWLYLGTLQPRKNIDALIEGFAATLPAAGKLIIAGKIGWKYQPKKQDRIRYLGFVPNDKLGALIKNSQGLILPSLYEGFGIPVVQAMSLGTPVLVSRNSSLPEIVGNTGLYIEAPFDSAAISDGLVRLLSLSPAEKQKLTAAAKLRAAKFSWQKTGQAILAEVV